MIRIALRSLWARKLRTTLTILAIMLGVAMISGTYVLTDQITKGFEDIFDQSTVGLDVVVTPKLAFQSVDYGAGESIDEAVLKQVEKTPGVGSAAGYVVAFGPAVVDGKPVSTGGAPPLVYSDTPQEFAQVTFVDGVTATEAGQAAINQSWRRTRSSVSAVRSGWPPATDSRC